MIIFTGEESIILFNKILVVSDLHIGIEKEYLLKGINIPSDTRNLLSKLYKLHSKYNPEILIILGDLKHNIPKISIQELEDVPYFLKEVSRRFDKVYILKGNHDGNIEKLIPKESNNIFVRRAIRINNIVLTHGHLKPKLTGRLYIIGHHHPVIRVQSDIGESFYEKVFVFAKTKNYSILILPAFSNLAGYWEAGQFHGPIAKNIQKYEVLSLDGYILYEKKTQ